MSSSDDTPAADVDQAVTTEPVTAVELLERYGGFPAHRERSEGQGDHGLLRLVFATDGDDDSDAKRISWEQFREEFEEKELALLYPEGTPEDATEAFALVKRDTLDG